MISIDSNKIYFTPQNEINTILDIDIYRLK